MSLSLCIRLYGFSPAKGAPLVCVWRGFKKVASLRQMNKCIEAPSEIPPVAPERVSMRPLQKRGKMALHPLVDSERHLHFTKFCSFVPLHNVTSPARLAALYVAARLFPSRWRELYSAAFNGEQIDKRAAITIDRFNTVMAEPDCYELIEIADIHTVYQRPMSRDVRVATVSHTESFYDAMKPIACKVFDSEKRKSSTTYQLTSFLAVAHAALNRAAHKQMVMFFVRHEVCTRRELRAFETVWLTSAPTLPSDAFVASVLGQFTFLK